MTKLEACKHLDQAMGLEGIDEKTWDTIFGIKSRLCFCNGEDEEDAKGLETVWYSIRDYVRRRTYLTTDDSSTSFFLL